MFIVTQYSTRPDGKFKADQPMKGGMTVIMIFIC